ncbi:MAG: FAD:protein FMN transferase [Clostridia bacterium]|nr:FAD:protein FMN transferase [Clostridia bacterium]
MQRAENKRIVNKKALIAVTLCAALMLCAVAADFVRSRSEYSDITIAMGTVVNIRLFGSDGEETANAVEENINETEKAMLSWREKNSDVDRINAAAGEAVSVSKETVDIINRALDVSKNCEGAFDITVGNLTRLWDFGGDNQRLPETAEIEKALATVNYSSVKITDTTVITADNQSLDLGAVGKGATCDRVKKYLQSTRTDSAVISVGGSLLLYGNRSFNIGIVNPENDNEAMGTLRLSDVCISTSGNYEKFFVEKGKTYHHILDARTGYPADSRLSGVTVVCSSGTLSDALSTACYILGYNDSLELLKKYDAQAVFVFKDKTVRVTDGLKNKFTLTDESFVVTE